MFYLSKIKSSKLIRNAGIYTAGHIFNAAIPFMLMPIMTRYLSPEDYGITAMLAVLMGIYTPFVGVNLHGFVSVSFFRNKEDFPVIVSTTFDLLAISILVAIFITYIFADNISALSLFPRSWLWVIICLCMTNYFVTVLQVIQQVQNHAKEYTIIQLGQTFINFALSITFVVVFTMNWQGRILAQVITGIVFMVISTVLLFRWELLKFVFSIKYAKQALAYGIPLIPHAMCGFLTVAADRLIISNVIGLDEVGIFTVGASIGKGIELLGASFNKAFCPWLFNKLKEFDEGRGGKDKVVRFSYLCMAIFIIFSVIYSVFMSYGLCIFLGQKFQSSSQYVFWFALASAFSSIYYLVTNYIFYVQKTHVLAAITFFSGIIHICLTYFMIKIYGAIGAAYSTVISQVLMTLATWWLANKVYPMPWIPRTVIK